MSKIINDVASKYDISTKSTIIINNDYDNSIKREDKPFIWISEEIFTLKRDKDKLQQENKQLKDVIEEAMEYINSKVISNGEIIDQLRKIEVKELLQMLDKAKN